MLPRVVLIADWLYALVTGLVQGLTEFLPISSSGHLSLLNVLFKRDPSAGLEFTFFLHIATLIAALVFFRNDIRDLIVSWLPKNEKTMASERRITVFLIASCLVTAPLALILEGKLAFTAGSFLFLGLAFLLTSVILAVTEVLVLRMTRNCRMDNMGFFSAAFVGFVQGCAVLPGLSRSGATIAAGMWAGLSRKEATHYSFMLVIPIIAAGALRDVIKVLGGAATLPPFWISLVGFVAAGVSGYLAIAGMLKLVQKTTLFYFSLYTALIGLVLIAVSFI